MRIVVTGGRDYTDWAMVDDVLQRLSPNEVFVGDCPTGVDSLVLEWCMENRVHWRVFRARWTELGKKAGPIRNGEMLRAAEEADLVIAFPGGSGTNDCVRQAVGLNRIVLRVEP